MAEDKSRGFNAARLSVCKHSYFFILFMIISWGLLKTLGRREGAGKIRGLRRGRARAAPQAGRPVRAGHIIVCPVKRGKRAGDPSRLKQKGN